MVAPARSRADGVGDTYVPRAHTAAPYVPANLVISPFLPSMHETLAIVVRRGTRLSPAADAFVAGLTTHILGLGVGLEASKTST